MLYIVGTPLGNLDDLSLRQAKTLLSSDIILAEDTRSTANLLSKLSELFPNLPKNPTLPKLISYYKEREFEKLPYVLELLANEKKVTLVSESGMPLVSDPGYLLVKTAVKRGISFTVIPGPVASITALIYSGFNAKQSMQLGFLPKKTGELTTLIKRLTEISKIMKETVYVFYESPNRINNTLKIISEVVPDADIVICREMTKMYEEIIRGKANNLNNKNYKGELTVCLNL